MKKFFGTDGLRGEANVHLTVEHAYKIGMFLGLYYSNLKNKKGKILIGKDTRRSSYMLEYALASGIVSTGSDVFLMHVTTTPSVSYVTRSEDFDCGVMITASHNIYYDNGIKILNSKGLKISKEIEKEIEKYLEKDNISFAKRENIGSIKNYTIGRNRYVGYLISIPKQSYQGLKIGLDVANGSAYEISNNVFNVLGAKTYIINNNPDGFNINKNCGSTNIEVLQKYVIDNKLDIGFAYDGDADRCIAVDEKGNIINGDLILYMSAKYLKKNNMLAYNTVVTTTMSNLGLYKAFDSLNIKYKITDVGDKYISKEMLKNNYTLGGEQSGHIIFGNYSVIGDGILTSLMILEILLKNKSKLSEEIRDVNIYPQILKNVEVNNKDKIMKNNKVKNIINKAKEELGKDARILVRKSGTEKVIRIMVEAKQQSLCSAYSNLIASVIEKENLNI